MEEKILDTIKKMLGIPVEVDNFDATIVVLVNTAITKLHQLGVLTKNESVFLTNGSETWDSIVKDEMYMGIQSYIFLQVRMQFDPPANSFVLDALQRSSDELEWRLQIQAEVIDKGEPDV